MLVLLLHHLGPPPPGVRQKKLYLTVEHLHAHVRWLQGRGYRFTTLTDALDATDPVACLTFDDGFTDIDVPLAVPATVFVVTSRVGERSVVFEGDQGVAPADLLGWEQLRALSARGWEIGSHAHRHTRKPSFEDLAESAATLERQLGKRPTALAYPYGAYDAETLEAARRAGFRCAATTKSGLASPQTPYQLRRVILSSFGVLPAFERLKLAGVHHGVYPLNPRPL
ncbi:MAG: polysaccharide deacetylase family protein [Archangiaceae bacterium]|nr:polysaccharide deacetylase family protein [Archangiaceae bacterium]